jgi:mitogen-activated protein kinase kinase
VSGPTSAGSQYSALSFASQYGIMNQSKGTPDPASAVGSAYSERSEGGVGMQRDDSMNGLLQDMDKMKLEQLRTMDVEELDDEGWRVASLEKRIVELGSLGEGAGGAVTRCILKGGKTVFALKVFPLFVSEH